MKRCIAWKYIPQIWNWLCSSRLEGVEARLQESSEAFEKSRDAAKKSKIEYEKVKKKR